MDRWTYVHTYNVFELVLAYLAFGSLYLYCGLRFGFHLLFPGIGFVEGLACKGWILVSVGLFGDLRLRFGSLE